MGFVKNTVFNSSELECSTILDDIILTMSEKFVDISYGHIYGYNNHDELINSKYFVESIKNDVAPLQIDTFHKKQPDLFTKQQSREIWDQLVQLKNLEQN